MKLLLIGGLVGLASGVGITVLYFSLANFFEVNAKALSEKAHTAIQKTAEKAKENAEVATATEDHSSHATGRRGHWRE